MFWPFSSYVEDMKQEATRNYAKQIACTQLGPGFYNKTPKQNKKEADYYNIEFLHCIYICMYHLY